MYTAAVRGRGLAGTDFICLMQKTELEEAIVVVDVHVLGVLSAHVDHQPPGSPPITQTSAHTTRHGRTSSAADGRGKNQQQQKMGRLHHAETGAGVRRGEEGMSAVSAAVSEDLEARLKAMCVLPWSSFVAEAGIGGDGNRS